MRWQSIPAPGVTESTAVPVIPSSTALIVAIPFVTPVATPCEPDAFEMAVARSTRCPVHAAGQGLGRVVGIRPDGVELLGISDRNKWIGRCDRERFQHRGAHVQHRLTNHSVERATIVLEPSPRPVARPSEPAVLEMDATELEEELHATWLVRSSVEPFEKVPVAANCSVSPLGTLELTGVTAIDAVLRGRHHEMVTASSLPGAPG